MYVVYLFKKHKINKFMSSYQIIRNVWLNFGMYFSNKIQTCIKTIYFQDKVIY